MNLNIVKKFEEVVQFDARNKEFRPIILKLGGTAMSKKDYEEFGFCVCFETNSRPANNRISIAGDFGLRRGENAFWDEEFLCIRFCQQCESGDWEWLYFKIPCDLVMKTVVLGSTGV